MKNQGSSKLRKIGLWVSLMVTFFVAASALTTARSAVTPSVTVDQSPLTVQQQLAPNITLMLDDSGSMAWDVIPDSPSSSTVDALVSSDINGLYYNPTTSYQPPFTVDGVTPYPTYSFTDSPVDGFNTATKVDLNAYDGSSDSANGTKPTFTASFTVVTPAVTTTYLACGSGSTYQASGTNSGKCVQVQPSPSAPTCSTPYTGIQGSGTTSVTCKTPSPTSYPGCPGGVAILTSGTNKNKCNNAPTYSSPGTSYCGSSPVLTFYTTKGGSGTTSTCTAPSTSTAALTCASTTYTVNTTDSSNNPGQCTAVTSPICNSGDTRSAGTCTHTVSQQTTEVVSMFTYTIKNGSTYTRYYVGDLGKCAKITAASPITVSNVSGQSFTVPVPAANCSDSDATRQNVANWFTYYHTRILMAKSGLMNAFATLDPTIRFGYGSINGSQASWISSTYSSTLRYPFTTATKSNNYLAAVQPFGNGDAGTQRANFWTWTSNVTPNNGTPLRQSLSAVGQYYMTNQPWQTDPTLSTDDKLACRSAYTILTTDGYWNSDSVTMPTYSGDVDGLPGTPAPSYFATLSCPSVTSPDTISLSGSNGSKVCSFTHVTQQAPTGKCTTTDTNNGYTYNATSQKCTKSGTTTTKTATLSCPTSSWTQSGSVPNVVCKLSTTSNLAPNGSCPTGGTYNSSTQKCENLTYDTVSNTGPSGASYIYSAAPPYSSGSAADGTSTLADVAMYYWLSDLRSDLTNEVPTSTEDPAFWQHMTTFTVGLFGQNFTLPGITPTGTTADQIFAWANGGSAIANFAWPTPNGSGNGIANNISDLVHAAVNGHGNFYSAADPKTFASGISDALKRVSERNGSGASLAANSTKLDTGTTTYQAVYFTGQWKGDIKAFAVDPSSGNIATTTTWTASASLPSAANRTIKTTANGSTAIDFVSGAALTSTQNAALGADAATQAAVINYLRGDASNEVRNNGDYRNRDTPMGDIVDSQPVYVSAPDANLFFGRTFTGSSSYATFAANNASRSPRLWVAANDGMLHGFYAGATTTTPALTAGQETYAYMPGSVILAGVANLANTNYGGNSLPHQYYNDGELTVADIYDSTAVKWRTVLVGTTGRGMAKAVYALDITNPAAPIFLWERYSGDGVTNSNYIGQIVGKPIIAQTADDGTSSTWSVLVGNGYNSTANTAALLQFNVLTGALTVRTTDTSTANGLASPGVWMSNVTSGVSTTAYAGDLNGNVWSFNLASTAAGTKIFTAKDSGNKAQPITAGMLPGKDPATGNVWLFFGTGRYLAQSELADHSVQTWYGIIVQSSSSTLVSNLSNGRSALTQRSIVAQLDATATTLAARAVSNPSANDMVGQSGWYIDLVPPDGTTHGERMVTPNQFQGSLLLGTTRVPESSDPCNPTGSGWIMALNPFSGTPPGATYFDINGDNAFTNSDKITSGGITYIVAGIGFSSIPNNPIFVGNTMLISFDNASTGKVDTAGTPGSLQRLSWRELVAQ